MMCYDANDYPAAATVTGIADTGHRRLDAPARLFLRYGGFGVKLLYCSCLMVTMAVSAWSARAAAGLSQEAIEKAYYASYAFEKKLDYAGALAALKPVLEHYPNGYTVNYRGGWLSYCNGGYSVARAYLKQAQLAYPSSMEILICSILIAVAEKDWARVERESLQAIKIDYYNVSANYWYAYSLMVNKKYEPSEGVSRKMLTIFPTLVMFLGTLGETLYAEGKTDEANGVFLSIKVLDPGNELIKKYLKSSPANAANGGRKKNNAR